MNSRIKQRVAVAGLLLVAGCAPTATNEAPVTTPRAPSRATSAVGLQGVMGQSAPTLEAKFGRPVLDVREGTARKLQFANQVCVLDAYLYPQRQGGDAVVTHVDARLPDGRDIDRASCVASLGAR